jgi:hypothetical protein
LRWLVEKVRSEELGGEEISFTSTLDGVSLTGHLRDVPVIKKTTIDALICSGCLSCDRSNNNHYNCVLTGKAYEAVDSNFSAPNLSAIPHLIPLAEVEHLDSELWERCRLSLSADGNNPKAWDEAVRTATVVLEERLRKLGKTESIDANATGEKIVNLIFGKNNTVLSGRLDDKHLQAYRHLYAGMMAVFRNQYAHRITDSSSEIGGAIIVFIDLLLKILDDIDWDSGDSNATCIPT